MYDGVTSLTADLLWDCRVLTAQDCALILGFPGAGKTSTIAAAVMALLSLGKSVLVSAYTNSAVDTILVKLAGLGAPILRLGRPDMVHPALKGYTLGSERYPDTSATGLQRVARDACLVSCQLQSSGKTLSNMQLSVKLLHSNKLTFV